MDYAREIARAGLSIGALKLNTVDPFQWASGYRMPIYNDNRMFLNNPEVRELVLAGLQNKATRLLDVPTSEVTIAGTATAGIPWGTLLADRLQTRLVYIRDKPKDHGMRNRIEGLAADKGFEGRRVIVVEDLISTGGSSAEAVKAVRDAGGDCRNCLSIFNYELGKADEAFGTLDPICLVDSVLTYSTLLDVARETRAIESSQVEMLREWRADPFGWGAARGFPKVEKK